MKTVVVKVPVKIDEECFCDRHDLENKEDLSYNTLEEFEKDFGKDAEIVSLSEFMTELNDEEYPTEYFVEYINVSKNIRQHFGIS